MGFLDEMVKQLDAGGGLEGLLQNQPQIAETARSFFGNDSSVGPSGGLQDILQQLQASGMGDLVASWLGSGQNQAVSPQQLQGALGEGTLAQFADGAGIDLGQAATVLAGILPQLVDQLSPNGTLAEGGGQGPDLGRVLGGLFGGAN